MKFECKICIDEGSSDEPCLLILKKAKYLKFDRDDWKKALRRCPFENYEDGKIEPKPRREDYVKRVCTKTNDGKKER